MFFTFVESVSAEVVLNEIGTSGDDDWIEVLNTATTSADLSGYYIKDTTDTNKTELSGAINSSEYKSFNVKYRMFNNSGDIIYFYKGTELLSTVKYGSEGGLCAPVGDQAIGRSPNATGDFKVLVSSTRDSANSASQYTCPTPTPDPTQTSTPTSSPTPSPVATKAATPSPTPTPQKTSKPENDDYDYSETDILGLRDELATPEPSKSPEPVIEEKQGVPVIAGLFIFGGVTLIGFAGFPIAKSRWLEYKKSKYNGSHE